MRTTSRLQQRYDHRIRDHVRRTGDLTIATYLGVPRSMGTRRRRDLCREAGTGRATVMRRMAHRDAERRGHSELADFTEPELRQESLKLRRPVQKLAALLRLPLGLLHASGFRLSGKRLPDEPAKRRILRAVDRARECLPSHGIVRFTGLSPLGFRRGANGTACTLDDRSSCPRTSPHRLTRAEIQEASSSNA